MRLLMSDDTIEETLNMISNSQGAGATFFPLATALGYGH